MQRGKLISGSTVLAAALCLPVGISAQETPNSSALVAKAFDIARASSETIEIKSVSCTDAVDPVVTRQGAALYFPCKLQELVEDGDDATMLVALLLSSATYEHEQSFRKEPSIGLSALAIGAALVGSQIDPQGDRIAAGRVMDRGEGEPPPPVAAYLPTDTKEFEVEAARAERIAEQNRGPDWSDERSRIKREERAADQRAESAEFDSVTDFLNLTNAIGFCPADGRAFLQRATEYAISPIQEDRILGLWADDRRHLLEPYLNDVTRCREG